jgi:tRNA pseudouridine38-40 synthase
MRYFIHLSYNGANYHGWQIQPNASSIQQTMENAVSLLLHQEINIVGCGRTDTGVHASSFYAHFETDNVFSIEQLKNLVFKLNSFLPNDIHIFSIFPVSDDLHARFSATSRTYKYLLTVDKKPFKNDFIHRIFYHPDLDMMNAACEILKTYEDFTSFSKLHTQTATNNCEILHAEWKWEDDFVGKQLVFTITANRFLRNMVRSITGTILDVGRGKLSLEGFKEVIESKNRCNAGTSLPAKALFLTHIEYPFDDDVLSKEIE